MMNLTFKNINSAFFYLKKKKSLHSNCLCFWPFGNTGHIYIQSFVIWALPEHKHAFQ